MLRAFDGGTGSGLDAMADYGVLRHFRWHEPVLLHDDAVPPERSAREQQRAGRFH